MIDDDLLLTAVVRVIKAEKPAYAVNVRVELGEIADDGGVMDVADDLEELESLGKLERAPAVDWSGTEPPPKRASRTARANAVLSTEGQPPRIDLAVAAVMVHDHARDLAARPKAAIYLLD